MFPRDAENSKVRRKDFDNYWLRDVKIQNAQFFAESLQLFWFKKVKLIQRIIPRKTLPLNRCIPYGTYPHYEEEFNQSSL
jgi:hypothetical protein